MLCRITQAEYMDGMSEIIHHNVHYHLKSFEAYWAMTD